MARAKTSIVKALRTIDAKLATLRQEKVEAVLRPLHRERLQLEIRIEKVNQIIAQALGKLGGKPKTVEQRAVTLQKKGKRIRRSSEDLKKVAHGVFEFVKSKGKTGVAPKEIKASFGNLFPSPVQFVKKYGGIQLHRKGPMKRSRYYGS
jgi:hypothetical protein